MQYVSSASQFTVVPMHEPPPLHVVPYVQRFPSSHEFPLGYVSAHVESPSHVRVTHVVLVHVAVEPPAHPPVPLHTVSYVHGRPSSHADPLG
jgi:hypothetical protein